MDMPNPARTHRAWRARIDRRIGRPRTVTASKVLSRSHSAPDRRIWRKYQAFVLGLTGHRITIMSRTGWRAVTTESDLPLLLMPKVYSPVRHGRGLLLQFRLKRNEVNDCQRTVIDGFATGHGAGPATTRQGRCHGLAVVLTLTAAQSARSLRTARGARSAHRAGNVRYRPAWPVLVCRRSGRRRDGHRPAMVRLVPRRSGRSGLGGLAAWVPGCFSGRLSAVVRRKRIFSILGVSVIPRQRTTPHR